MTGDGAPYPPGFEADVVLDDGRTVHVRPVVPGDAGELAAAVARADPETLHERFLGGRPPRTEEEVLRLVTLDHVRRFAVAAFDEHGRGVGIARYEGERTWPVVELAVVVDPAWRGVGLARRLVHDVSRRALDLGAERATATFWEGSVPVLGLLEEAGLPERRVLGDAVVEDEIDLSGAGPGTLAPG